MAASLGFDQRVYIYLVVERREIRCMVVFTCLLMGNTGSLELCLCMPERKEREQSIC